jgi:molybdopterin-guanine dinucleotide biosynthesis protein A
MGQEHRVNRSDRRAQRRMTQMPHPAGNNSTPPTAGAILAGGLARRLGGGDKALRLVGGRTVLARLIDRLAPQVAHLIINANDDPARFDAGLPIVPDSLLGHPGPLAGVLAVLEWTARTVPAIEWVVTVPGDTPFLPPDLVQRLHAARRRETAALACAGSLGRTHPVIALWPVSIRDELRTAIADQGIRAVNQFTARHSCAVEQWAAAPVDPFFNVNTPEDLTEAERLAAIHP